MASPVINMVIRLAMVASILAALYQNMRLGMLRSPSIYLAKEVVFIATRFIGMNTTPYSCSMPVVQSWLPAPFRRDAMRCST